MKRFHRFKMEDIVNHREIKHFFVYKSKMRKNSILTAWLTISIPMTQFKSFRANAVKNNTQLRQEMSSEIKYKPVLVRRCLRLGYLRYLRWVIHGSCVSSDFLPNFVAGEEFNIYFITRYYSNVHFSVSFDIYFSRIKSQVSSRTVLITAFDTSLLVSCLNNFFS